MASFDQESGEAGTRDGEGFVAPACRHCDVIREIAFCSGLSRPELQQLVSIRDQLQYPSQQTVFREGDEARYIYAITSGAAKLYKLLPDGRRQIVGFLFPGDVFGLALETGYAYTAETVTYATACRFPQRKLDEFKGHVPVLDRRLFTLAVKEIERAHEQMLLLGRKTAREKLASFLLSLSRRAEERGQPPSPVALPMSRSDIADFLGLTIETVSRTITQLKKAGTIQVPDTAHVVLREIDQLRRMAEGG
jgi:CRP/FNR family transcriptional regulator